VENFDLAIYKTCQSLLMQGQLLGSYDTPRGSRRWYLWHPV